MAKEKSEGDAFSAIGSQTMARAYSAMDYYFDHLKETVWRASKRPRRGVYQSGIWSNHEATPGTVMHKPLLST
jgi:hypothetical protein